MVTTVSSPAAKSGRGRGRSRQDLRSRAEISKASGSGVYGRAAAAQINVRTSICSRSVLVLSISQITDKIDCIKGGIQTESRVGSRYGMSYSVGLDLGYTN